MKQKTKENPRVVYLTQVPGPYRERMHELIWEKNPNYSVLYCARLEPDRLWKIDHGNYPQQFMEDKADGFRHNQTEVWSYLNKLNPDVLIITAFKPTMMYGVFWCMMKGRKLVVYNDGTYISELRFSWIQKLLRRFVFSRTKAFVTTGKGGFDLYRSYGILQSKMFKSCLCIDNSKFTPLPMEEREYHIMFSGQIVERKMPMFFVEVAKRLHKKFQGFKALIVGEGDQRKEMLEELDRHGVAYHFAGYLDQKTLPSYYSKAKLFLFPSLNDPWGVVGNEACAAGTPVITCENAGVANDLITHNENGYILSLDAEVWADHALQLLTDKKLLTKFSENAVRAVQSFNHQQSADGIIDSVSFALS